MRLYDKIYRVMVELFKLIGAAPTHPVIDYYGDSESDYEEFKEEQETTLMTKLEQAFARSF